MIFLHYTACMRQLLLTHIRHKMSNFHFFFAFFLAKKRNIQHMQQKNIDELHKKFNIFLEESLELKESLFKLLDHLLYIKYDLSKKA